MPDTNGFNDEEWNLLRRLPIEVAAAASIADEQNSSGSTREVMTAINSFLTGALLLRHNELISALFAEYKTDGQGEAALLKLSQDPPAGLVDRALEHATHVVRVLSSREDQIEAAEYTTWLSEMATDIVFSSKAGGFLGIGGTRVTEGEQAFIKSLNDILGLPTPSFD